MIEPNTPAPIAGLSPMKAVPSVPTPLSVNVVKAAAMIGVSVKTVRREIQRGHIPCVRLGRLLLIRVAALDAYLRKLEMYEREKPKHTEQA